MVGLLQGGLIQDDITTYKYFITFLSAPRDARAATAPQITKWYVAAIIVVVADFIFFANKSNEVVFTCFNEFVWFLDVDPCMDARQFFCGRPHQNMCWLTQVTKAMRETTFGCHWTQGKGCQVALSSCQHICLFGPYVALRKWTKAKLHKSLVVHGHLEALWTDSTSSSSHEWSPCTQGTDEDPAGASQIKDLELRERERERERKKKKHDRIWRYDLSSDVLKTCVTHIISKHIWYQFGYMIGHLDGLLQKGCEPLSTLATDEYNSLSCGRSIVACLAHCWTHWSLDEQEFKQWNIFWNVAWMINFVHMMHYHTTRLVSSTLRVPTCCLFFIYSTWWAVIVGHLFVQWKCLTFRVTYLKNLWHCNEHEMFFDDNYLLQKCRQYNDIHTLGIIGYDHIIWYYDIVWCCFCKVQN